MDGNIDKYTYRLEWSNEHGGHFARCIEFPGIIAYGENPEEALSEIKSLIFEMVGWLREENEPVPEPVDLRTYTGNITLHISPLKHKELFIKSSEVGLTLNQYIVSKV